MILETWLRVDEAPVPCHGAMLGSFSHSPYRAVYDLGYESHVMRSMLLCCSA